MSNSKPKTWEFLGIPLLVVLVFAGIIFLQGNSKIYDKGDFFIKNQTAWNAESILNDPQSFIHGAVSKLEAVLAEKKSTTFDLDKQKVLLSDRQKIEKAKFARLSEKVDEQKRLYESLNDLFQANPGNQALKAKVDEAEQKLAKLGKLHLQSRNLINNTSSLIEQNNSLAHLNAMQAIELQNDVAELQSAKSMAEVMALAPSDLSPEAFSEVQTLLANMEILKLALSDRYEDETLKLEIEYGFQTSDKGFIESILDGSYLATSDDYIDLADPDNFDGLVIGSDPALTTGSDAIVLNSILTD